MGTNIMNSAKFELDSCSASLSARLDMYAEAAYLGNIEGLYLWGMVNVFGIESPSSKCGAFTDIASTLNDNS